MAHWDECRLIPNLSRGLAAWRNSASTCQGSAKGHGYGSTTKRSKGPIITKYTPHPPQPSFGPGAHPYASQPPGAHRPPVPYAGLNQPYQPYLVPPPPLSVGYPQPAYLYHLPSGYTPYGPSRYGQQGPLGPSPKPPPPVIPFAPGRPSVQEYHPPLPPYPQPFSHAAPSHRPATAKHSPTGSASSPKSATALSKPLNTRISHPLPPKPPPSHNQINPQRDPRNKRKFDRPYHQENRHRSFGPPTSHTIPYSGIHHGLSNVEVSADRAPPARSPSYKGFGLRENGPTLPREVRLAHVSADKKSGQAEADGALAITQDKTTTALKSVPADPVTETCDPANDVQKRSWSCDGTDPQRPEAVQKHVISPQRTAAGGSPRECAGPGDRPARSSSPSDDQEDGEISSSEAGPSPLPTCRDLSVERQKSCTPSLEDRWKRKRRRSDEPDDGEASSKRSNIAAPVEVAKCRASGEDGVNGNLWNSLDVPRQADRKRRGSNASCGSRHSSMSSKSSDLNSFEAELLGRPKNQRQQEPSPPLRQRLERKTPSKHKRRQNNTNSAYR